MGALRDQAGKLKKVLMTFLLNEDVEQEADALGSNGFLNDKSVGNMELLDIHTT